MHLRFIGGIVLAAMLIVYIAPAPTSAAVLTDAQISSITTLLTSFGVDASIIRKVEQVLSGNTVTDGSHPVVPDQWRHNICKRLLEAQTFPTYGTQSTFAQDLQDFLAKEGFFNEIPTGFYGTLTRKAIGEWQAKHGLVIAGDVAQGWGVFGPRTRERIKEWCSGSTTPPTCGTDAKPVCALKQVQCITTPCNPVPTTYSNRCAASADDAKVIYGGECKTDVHPFTENKPPVISGFSGPTTLIVNETGTWTVSASDPENGTLSYRISWGDEAADRMLTATAFSDAFVQTSTFTHTYSTAGTYAVIIIVRDDKGNMGYMSTKVKVTAEGDTGGGTVCTQEYTPVCGQPPEPACRRSTPACMVPTPGPRTYSNTCVMKAASATLLYTGECKTESTTNSNNTSCVFASTTYHEGLTLYGDPCPGQACAAIAGPLLTCHAGQWVMTNGESICSIYNVFASSSLWQQFMPDRLKVATKQYYQSLGCSL
ncbi:peptidoglycan-binding protein [Candidatus Kaiserbacteria bacterium]|nr:peptidoglycan-binding protein [Candidatus Kaiserbacteria bacterium]